MALARAIVPRPGVLLMDEPFSGLDSRLRDSVRADTLSVLLEAGATAVVVTHDPEEAMRMADRIVLMRGGRIAQEGRAEELYDRPQSLFVARFFSALAGRLAASPYFLVPAYAPAFAATPRCLMVGSSTTARAPTRSPCSR